MLRITESHNCVCSFSPKPMEGEPSSEKFLGHCVEIEIYYFGGSFSQLWYNVPNTLLKVPKYCSPVQRTGMAPAATRTFLSRPCVRHVRGTLLGLPWSPET